jgi:hypothetical protein
LVVVCFKFYRPLSPVVERDVAPPRPRSVCEHHTQPVYNAVKYAYIRVQPSPPPPLPPRTPSRSVPKAQTPTYENVSFGVSSSPRNAATSSPDLVPLVRVYVVVSYVSQVSQGQSDTTKPSSSKSLSRTVRLYSFVEKSVY